MQLYGLIGYPLIHSFSQKFFSEKFSKSGLEQTTYLNFEIDAIEKLESLMISYPDLKGFNVTIPYKEKVLHYLNSCDEIATEVGAVNTVKIFSANNKKILKGYNTDVFGFEKSIQPLISNHHKSALILGTGGASKAVVYVLKKMNINFTFVSRFKSENKLTYEDLNQNVINQNLIIINTTPVGTFPDVNSAPAIPFEWLTPDHLCYDLIYNPELTLFLTKSKQQGATIKNGLEMLQLQAEKAWQIWNDADA